MPGSQTAPYACLLLHLMLDVCLARKPTWRGIAQEDEQEFPETPVKISIRHFQMWAVFELMLHLQMGWVHD